MGRAERPWRRGQGRELFAVPQWGHELSARCTESGPMGSVRIFGRSLTLTVGSLRRRAAQVATRQQGARNL